MKALRMLVLLSCLLMLAGTALASEHLRLATTTSTENSGLLAELLPPFEQANNCKVDVIAVGTGKAIKLGENGDVDVVVASQQINIPRNCERSQTNRTIHMFIYLRAFSPVSRALW